MAEPRKPTPARRGFVLDCPYCGHDDSVTVNLGDVMNFTCVECEVEFDADAVRRLIDQWEAALAWLETAPVIEE